jgi:methyltransferase-like protein
VANLRHVSVALTPTDRHILTLLDGRRDRAALMDALVGMVETGRSRSRSKVARSVTGNSSDRPSSG